MIGCVFEFPVLNADEMATCLLIEESALTASPETWTEEVGKTDF